MRFSEWRLRWTPRLLSGGFFAFCIAMDGKNKGISFSAIRTLFD
jgi:hypothetical protein